VVVEELLKKMALANASDLYIKVGRPPVLRVDGKIHPMNIPPLKGEDVEKLADEIMTPEQRSRFQRTMEMDLAYSLAGVGRFRINLFRQRSFMGIVMRLVRKPTFSFEELNLPPIIRQLSEMPRGLILVTGTTGSGKSTTLAAMLNHINNIRRCHIVTIEDPIEFLHDDNMAIVNQREIGLDTLSFSEALRHVVRQAPDVIMIGEMRDLETIQTAISAAETGHLVLSTLHTIDATTTVERIINYFPAYLHQQIRMELALCLKGVVSMRLLPRASGVGRIPSMEVMINTPSIRKLLMEGKTTSLMKFIEEGEHMGMQTFNQSLVKLYQQNMITYEDALTFASNPDEFKLTIQGISTGVRSKGVRDSSSMQTDDK
jgi:twitching motility protein PilT